MHVIEGATQGPRDLAGFDYARLLSRFDGLYMANNGYDLNLAEDARAHRRADLVARLRGGIPLAPSDDKTHWYGGAAEGYTDYRPAA